LELLGELIQAVLAKPPRFLFVNFIQGGAIMLHWAITFLIIGLVAALLGVSGVAGTATYIAYVLFVFFIIVAIVSLVMGKRPPA
jgi:uncharacterized membrane protein YtjA (UPF0391 family)